MALLYRKRSETGNELKQQRRWLKGRDRCLGVECIRMAYSARIIQLSDQAAAPTTRAEARPTYSGPAGSGDRTIMPVTEEVLNGLTIQVPNGDGSSFYVTLKDGSYVEKQKVEPSDTTEYPDMTVDIAMTAFGDLNGDNITDAAFIGSYYPGGNAVFYFLTAVVGASGKPLVTAPLEIGYHVQYKKIKIESGKILIFVGSPDGDKEVDCCPSGMASLFYRVKNNALLKLRN
jgi:uncharacterized protein